jgi:hypothetical protein
MSGTARSYGRKEERRFGKGSEENPKAEMRQVSLFPALEYVRRVPDIRRDKVTAVRRRMATGSWSPRSTRVAEKLLYEHLFDLTMP